MMFDVINNVIKKTFGEKSTILHSDVISNGYKNITFKVECNQYKKPLFLKIEKNFDLPRTQKFQIKREIVGINLCRDKGINVPIIINSDDRGTAFGMPWILEEFIDGSLISEFNIESEDRYQLGMEFEDVFTKLISIGSNHYGDTFEGGIIGKHSSWNDTISKITYLLFEDCCHIGLFDKGTSLHLVEQALIKALSYMKCNSEPVIFHYDLFSQNVFGIEKEDGIHVGTIIDFGMSLFAPVHFVQYLTRKLTDFEMERIDVSQVYGVEQRELRAYDIIRIEPLLLLNLMGYVSTSMDYISETKKYINKCRQYISS